MAIGDAVSIHPDLLLPFVWLLGVHWLADFVLQTHWQATNKSKRLDALALHVFTYTAALALGSVLLFPRWPSFAWPIFVAVNGAAHFVTDFFTSRWSSKLYAKQDYHNFFVVIGLDQLIHHATLAATLAWALS